MANLCTSVIISVHKLCEMQLLFKECAGFVLHTCVLKMGISLFLLL